MNHHHMSKQSCGTVDRVTRLLSANEAWLTYYEVQECGSMDLLTQTWTDYKAKKSVSEHVLFNTHIFW